MKQILLTSLMLFFLISCGGVKKTQEALNTGNYGNAINTALKNIAENKTKKSNQPYIQMLEEAYKKNTERELQEIAFLKKDNNPANHEIIFNGYQNLKSIQERIKPLLPLKLYDENRDARFSFKDYDEEIIKSKRELSDYLYSNATALLNTGRYKEDFRKAFDQFSYLNDINPNYKDTQLKLEEAHDKGLDYVQVVMINDSEQIVPNRLEQELLNFNTYGLNDLWTVYHTNALENIKYDYEMQVAFRNINISPEQVTEKQISKEKQIKDGYKYATNQDGEVLKDSLGNKIKIDKFKTVKCNFYQFTQLKSVEVVGNVSFLDLNSQQQINSYPLASQFVFNHVYAKHNGDTSALEEDMVPLLQLSAVPFPSNEQMVYDAGEDLKAKLKGIVTRHRFN
ncbi:hypothetical protein [Arenibacter algicola]|jgi:uncharacterized protein YxeA|uniref:Lipoprotein n=1 Tax=Arenibacter algicola TaxID=616991 RepID=A0A221V4I5_9FLAO|nr:hypothetical protein [Arenibacter algicola]ASO08021.1 hypothetical protein AREALGSMS7_04627 [Arenibacter algicola]|tara:strand:+ start:9009 stop:10196 length:1188 start_codon:yes stop_codon:yes gene_type:complete